MRPSGRERLTPLPAPNIPLKFHIAMKTFRTYIYAALAASCAVTAGGCSDELDLPNGGAGREIRFSASLTDTHTRSEGIRPCPAVTERSVVPMTVRETGDSMYLHSEVLDWDDTDVSAGLSTRSNMVHSNSGMYDRFCVSAYHYTDGWTSDKANQKPNYFHMEGTSGSMEGGYDMDSRRYWPAEGKMRFLAYAPFNAGNTGAYTMQYYNETTGPYVHIEVDPDAANHRDLLVAYTGEFECSGSRSAVPMNFKHALSCIQFVMADDMETCRIKKITVHNAKYAGDLRYNTTMADASASSADADATLNNSYYAWELYRDISLDFTKAGYPDGKESPADSLVTDEEHSFMMFPQVLPENASVEVTLSRQQEDGSWGADEVMLGYLSGKRWPAGKIVRYRISNDRWWQELQVSGLPTFTPFGGTEYFGITSFDVDDNGNLKAVPWTATFEDPAHPGTFTASVPDWYGMAATGDGSVTPDSIAVTANAVSKPDHTIDMDKALTNVGSYGSQSAPYNLSANAVGKTSVGTTANCYVVDRPGWYILPLVYGNAVVNGKDNPQAYHPNVSASNGALQNFVNCLGDDISSPYILTDCSSKASQVTASSAKIVWQDHLNLIRSTSVSVDKTAFGGHGGIVFQVTAGDIKQGNCVLGLELPGQSGQMMWSWHIWVTPFLRGAALDPLLSESIGITNYEGATHDMMYVNLGWRSVDPVEFYKERTSRVKFTATTDDGRTLTKIMSVIQAPFVKYWHGTNTYYQWGRKDPFMPFPRSYDEKWYDGDGAEHTLHPTAAKWGGGAAAIRQRILNPGIFHTADDKWGQLDNGSWNYIPQNISLFTNLWDATYSVKPTVNKYDPAAIEPVSVPARENVKSVYDPSPAGYKVASTKTFTGFTNTGNNLGELKDKPKNWNGMLLQYSHDCGGDPVVNDPYVFLFYTNEQQSSYIAFPTTGYRDWRVATEPGDNVPMTSGADYQMGVYGYSWCAGAAGDIQGYYLELRKDAANFTDPTGWIMPLDYFWQLDGLTVRPCRE